MCHDVDWIRNHYQNSLARVPQDRRHHLLEHGRVPLKQVQPGLVRSLCNSGNDHHYPTTGQVSVISGPDCKRVGKRHRVQYIVRGSLSPSTIHVHQNDFPADTIHHQSKGRG
jgi:hypothetical protein